MGSLLYADRIVVNEHIAIKIPTVGEVMDCEAEYYNLASLLTATPYDLMVELDDMGIDFTQLSDYELFRLTFQSLAGTDTSMIFGDLDVAAFQLSMNAINGQVVLRDASRNIVIDKAIYWKISQGIRMIHGWERNNKKPANKEACDYLLERTRIKRKRRKKKEFESQLEDSIVALVNSKEFKYDYESVRKLSIYQFNQSLRQVIHRVAYDNLMRGVYAGTISAKELSQDDLNWLKHK